MLVGAAENTTMTFLFINLCLTGRFWVTVALPLSSLCLIHNFFLFVFQVSSHSISRVTVAGVATVIQLVKSHSLQMAATGIIPLGKMPLPVCMCACESHREHAV